MTREELDITLCRDISAILNDAIEQKGQASIGVSGGSTPLNLFEHLSKTHLDWEKVSVFPIDERFLEDEHRDQNGTLIRNHFLKSNAKAAKFFPLVYDTNDYHQNLTVAESKLSAIQAPYDVIVLGMGLDGHTASLFPEIDNLSAGLDANNQQLLINTQPKNAPYKRISMTKAAIFKSNHLFLHMYGEEKKLLFDKATIVNDPYQFPILAFASHSNFKIYWTK